MRFSKMGETISLEALLHNKHAASRKLQLGQLNARLGSLTKALGLNTFGWKSGSTVY